jgi:hypothetical protein
MIPGAMSLTSLSVVSQMIVSIFSGICAGAILGAVSEMVFISCLWITGEMSRASSGPGTISFRI